MEIELIYEDEALLAINKPHGLLVHRSSIAKDATEYALQMVREKVGSQVHLAHRLDRKTSGVLLLAKSKIHLKSLNALFRQREIKKTYLALVRGYVMEDQLIDYPLKHPSGKIQEAQTQVSPLRRYEYPMPSHIHDSSRYSLCELAPQTGRFHQLRKHMAHLRHPIIGDRPHGCNKQNKLWKEKLQMQTMLLHAASLEFTYEAKQYQITAPLSPEFDRVLALLKEFTQWKCQPLDK